jgi:hypothetical protein
MSAEFIKPNFSVGYLELRCDKGEISIYGNKHGLVRLNKLIIDLIDKPQQGHIHLEDYEILTPNSEKGTIAIFE